jgi:lipopolysaccharide export system permease protein
MFTVAQLTGFVAAFNVPLALPLAILLSAIMTFGNLGETFELVAIKSAGIPLTRFMQPLFITTILLCGAAFLFNNNIIPIATLKMKTLKYDIIKAKPAFNIREGVFYDEIPGFVIKIGKKEKDDKTISNIIIYEKNYGLQDNIIVANSGEMKVTDDQAAMEFVLKDGWRYEEDGNNPLTTNTDYIRMGFKEYKKVFDLSSLKMNKTEDSVFKDNYKMLSVRQLNKRIDSLDKGSDFFQKRVTREVNTLLNFTRDLDTGWVAVKTPVAKIRNIEGLVRDSTRLVNIYERVTGNINMVKNSLDMSIADYDTKVKDLRFHRIEWHRKFAMSFACMVLFLIGAPLGSIIRKGGLGMPLILAVIFFVVFFLLNNFGEKLVKENILIPAVGMWAATIVLLPVGFFLISKARKDSDLFNVELYVKLFAKFKKKKKDI